MFTAFVNVSVYYLLIVLWLMPPYYVTFAALLKICVYCVLKALFAALIMFLFASFFKLCLFFLPKIVLFTAY